MRLVLNSSPKLEQELCGGWRKARKEWGADYEGIRGPATCVIKRSNLNVHPRMKDKEEVI